MRWLYVFLQTGGLTIALKVRVMIDDGFHYFDFSLRFGHLFMVLDLFF